MQIILFKIMENIFRKILIKVGLIKKPKEEPIKNWKDFISECYVSDLYTNRK